MLDFYVNLRIHFNQYMIRYVALAPHMIKIVREVNCLVDNIVGMHNLLNFKNYH